MKKIFAGLLGLVLLGAGCKSQSMTQNATTYKALPERQTKFDLAKYEVPASVLKSFPTWKTYSSKTMGVSFSYPSSMTVMEADGEIQVIQTAHPEYEAPVTLHREHGALSYAAGKLLAFDTPIVWMHYFNESAFFSSYFTGDLSEHNKYVIFRGHREGVEDSGLESQDYVTADVAWDIENEMKELGGSSGANTLYTPDVIAASLVLTR